MPARATGRKDFWKLPGGLVDQAEDIQASAIRGNPFCARMRQARDTIVSDTLCFHCAGLSRARARTVG